MGVPGQRIASTSNRNFVGRQGRGVLEICYHTSGSLGVTVGCVGTRTAKIAERFHYMNLRTGQNHFVFLYAHIVSELHAFRD